MSKKPFPAPYAVLTELLVAARADSGLTQEALAERLSIGQSAVSKVERGVQRLDLFELRKWLLATNGPSLTEFVQAFDDRVRKQTAVQTKWAKRRRPGRTDVPAEPKPEAGDFA